MTSKLLEISKEQELWVTCRVHKPTMAASPNPELLQLNSATAVCLQALESDEQMGWAAVWLFPSLCPFLPA